MVIRKRELHKEEKSAVSKFSLLFLDHPFQSLRRLVLNCVPIDKSLLKPLEKLHLDFLHLNLCVFHFGYGSVILREFNIKLLHLSICNTQRNGFTLPTNLEGLIVHGIPTRVLSSQKGVAFSFELSAWNCNSLRYL